MIKNIGRKMEMAVQYSDRKRQALLSHNFPDCDACTLWWHNTLKLLLLPIMVHTFSNRQISLTFPVFFSVFPIFKSFSRFKYDTFLIPKFQIFPVFILNFQCQNFLIFPVGWVEFP